MRFKLFLIGFIFLNSIFLFSDVNANNNTIKKIEDFYEKINVVSSNINSKLPYDLQLKLEEKKNIIDELYESYSYEIYSSNNNQDSKKKYKEFKQRAILNLISSLSEEVSLMEKVQKNSFIDESEKYSAYNILMSSMIKENGTNMLIIKSPYSLDKTKKNINLLDESVIVEHFFGDYYKIIVPKESFFYRDILTNIEEGIIPENIYSFNVVEPTYLSSIGNNNDIDILSILDGTDYLNGELSENLWGINKMGANNYQKGLSLNGNEIKVGVIDTGIDIEHIDIQNNVYINTGEIPGNGIDDDNNGYIDDLYGYNFVGDDGNIEDRNNHGTHVGGTVAGSVNGEGIYGVNSNAKLIGLKVLNRFGRGNSYNIANAIKYAGDNGIEVINLSLGGVGIPTFSMMCDAIDYALDKGTISVVAAGNSNENVSMYVPAGCQNVITVSAVDSDLQKASFSNYGDLVDIAAPGVEIYSSIPGSDYIHFNGTSMASPHIAGLVSAIMAYDSSYIGNLNKLKDILKNNVDQTISDSSIYIGGFANMEKVMNQLGINKDYEDPKNQAPTVSLRCIESSKLNSHSCRVISNDEDGDVVSTKKYIDGRMVNSLERIVIKKDTKVEAIVKDNDGATARDTVLLKYIEDPKDEDPKDEDPKNQAPTVSLRCIESSKLNSHSCRVISNDEDGDVVSTKKYIDGRMVNSLERIVIKKDTKVEAIVKDNDGATARDTVLLKYIEDPKDEDPKYEDPKNQAPTVSLRCIESSKLNSHSCRVISNDEDGDVVSTKKYIDGRMVNSLERIVIKKDTKVEAIVKDNDGATARDTVLLKYIEE